MKNIFTSLVKAVDLKKNMQIITATAGIFIGIIINLLDKILEPNIPMPISSKRYVAAKVITKNMINSFLSCFLSKLSLGKMIFPP
jgi:hypothetical protein